MGVSSYLPPGCLVAASQYVTPVVYLALFIIQRLIKAGVLLLTQV